MQAEMGSAWERKYSRGTDQDAGSGVVFHVTVVAWGRVAWCQPQSFPMGIAGSHGCGKGTGRVQAVPGWPASSMSVTAEAGERKRKKHAV